VEKYGRARQATDDNIIQRMRFACWITKATDTLPEYVTLIALPRQQRSRERATILNFYVHCLSCYSFKVFILPPPLLNFATPWNLQPEAATACLRVLLGL
jgi:hypothetical protein